MIDDIADNCAITKEIKALKEEYVNALRQQNVSALDRLLAGDFILVKMTGAQVSKSEFLGQIGAGNLVYAAISSPEPLIRIYGDTAVAMNQSGVNGIFRGHAFGGQFRGLDVFAKIDGRWQCVITQETGITFSTEADW